jgi:hypothetical protein
MAAGRIRSIAKSNELIGNRTRNFSSCSIVPQPTTLTRAPAYYYMIINFLYVNIGSITQDVYNGFPIGE